MRFADTEEKERDLILVSSHEAGHAAFCLLTSGIQRAEIMIGLNCNSRGQTPDGHISIFAFTSASTKGKLIKSANGYAGVIGEKVCERKDTPTWGEEEKGALLHR
jgi:hypothetical protein